MSSVLGFSVVVESSMYTLVNDINHYSR